MGSLDGDDWELFGDVSQVGFDAAGNLYVFDRQNYRVVVVDTQGRFVRQFGLQGDGPGEWRMPGGMGVMPDGSVVIADAGHRAYQIYGPDGGYRSSVSMGDGGIIRIGRLVADPRGGALFNVLGGGGITMSMMRGAEAPAEPEGRPIERVTLGEGGAVQPCRDVRSSGISKRGARSRVPSSSNRMVAPSRTAPSPSGSLPGQCREGVVNRPRAG